MQKVVRFSLIAVFSLWTQAMAGASDVETASKAWLYFLGVANKTDVFLFPRLVYVSYYMPSKEVHGVDVAALETIRVRSGTNTVTFADLKVTVVPLQDIGSARTNIALQVSVSGKIASHSAAADAIEVFTPSATTNKLAELSRAFERIMNNGPIPPPGEAVLRIPLDLK